MGSRKTKAEAITIKHKDISKRIYLKSKNMYEKKGLTIARIQIDKIAVTCSIIGNCIHRF